MSKKPLLTISLLISNRPDTVEKCLDSLNHLREVVPSELILVDTGCGEKVRSIIEKYTDNIVDFVWCADFAKARNAGMSKARGEWFLYLDDDEWFEDTKAIEDFFISGEWKKYGYAVYTQRNYANKKGTVYSDALVGRMVRLQNGVRFKYSIHECFTGVSGATKNIHSYVHHYGYVYESQKDFYLHSQRNIVPLLKEHQKDKRNLRHNAQLAQEYNATGEYKKSIEISLEGIQNDPRTEGSCKYVNTLFANVANIYYKMYDYLKVIEYGELYLKDDRLNITAEATILSVLGNAYFEVGNYKDCLRIIEKYVKAKDDYTKNEENFLKYMILLMDPFSSQVYNQAIGYGIRAAMKQKNAELAEKYFQRINLEEKPLFINDPMLEDIVKTYMCCGEQQNRIYGEMLEKLLKQKVLSQIIIYKLQEMAEKEPENFRGTSAKWKAIEKSHWYISYLAMWTEEQGDNSEHYEKSYRALWTNTSEILQCSNKTEIFELAEKHNINISKVITDIPFYKWKKAVDSCFNVLDWEDIQKLNKKMEGIDSESFHYLWWEICYIQKSFREMNPEETEISADNVKTDMLSYGEACWKLFSDMYKDELFATMSELLPECCQVAFWITDLFQQEQTGDFIRMVDDLKKIRDICADFAIPVKVYLEDISVRMKKQKEEQNKANDELERMAKVLKAKVKELIQLQKYTEAYGIIEQMEQMLPNDPELAELKKQCE